MKSEPNDDPPERRGGRPFWSVFSSDSLGRHAERHAESRFAGSVTLWLIAIALAAVVGLVAIDRAGLTPDWIKDRCDARGGLRC